MASFQTVIFALGTRAPAVHLCDLHSTMIFSADAPRSKQWSFVSENPILRGKLRESPTPVLAKNVRATCSKSAPTWELLTEPTRWNGLFLLRLSVLLRQRSCR